MTNIALVTGATKGIGLAISTLLKNSGYEVIGLARNDPSHDFPGKFFKCDLSSVEQTDEVLIKVKELYPYINCIINNVGITIPQELGEIELKSLSSVYDLNVRAAVQVTQAFVKQMKDKQHGRIINISSRAIFGVKKRSSYAAAKIALVGLTRTWALELASYGITVNAVAPGPMETDLFRESHPKGSREEKIVIDSIPVGRIGKPDEIAAMIQFLLSDKASFITGQTICIDGGGSL